MFTAIAVDDEKTSLHRISRLVEEDQRVKMVATFSDCLQALDYVSTHQVDLVFLDIEMPEMDGYTLTTSIRKDDRLKDLFVILNSSLSGGFNDKLTEKVGANKFLSKWHSEELANEIVKRIEFVTSKHKK